MWDLEKQGVARPFRLLQKRGAFVDCENFSPVGATYPVHPLTKVEPNARNLAELQHKRKEEIKQNLLEIDWTA